MLWLYPFQRMTLGEVRGEARYERRGEARQMGEALTCSSGCGCASFFHDLLRAGHAEDVEKQNEERHSASQAEHTDNQ